MSAERNYRRPSTPDEVYRECKKAWINERTLLITKYQQAKLSKTELEIIASIGKKLYGMIK